VKPRYKKRTWVEGRDYGQSAPPNPTSFEVGETSNSPITITVTRGYLPTKQEWEQIRKKIPTGSRYLYRRIPKKVFLRAAMKALYDLMSQTLLTNPRIKDDYGEQKRIKSEIYAGIAKHFGTTPQRVKNFRLSQS